MRKKNLDSKARSQAPGKFIKLTHGMVHYQIKGPSGGQPVVLVHGFSVPSYIWDPTFEFLVKEGFRTLRYDLYGRGYSDRPAVNYDRKLYDNQLLELLTSLDINLPVDLVGLSMGGAISVAFADRHPSRVRRLCLVDPAGLMQEPKGVEKLKLIPFVGELYTELFLEKKMLSTLGMDFYDYGRIRGYEEKMLTQMSYKGFKRALLSTLRNGLLSGMLKTYERVGEMAFPSLLFWGMEDRIIPFETSDVIRDVLPTLRFCPIERAGHLPHYERPDKVNPVLLDFLNQKQVQK